MKQQSAYERMNDQRVADDATTPDDLACRAQGCPNRWTVDSADRGIHKLCSAHAWSEPNLWPQITAEQNEAVFARMNEPVIESPHYSDEAKRMILAKLRALVAK